MCSRETVAALEEALRIVEGAEERIPSLEPLIMRARHKLQVNV